MFILGLPKGPIMALGVLTAIRVIVEVQKLSAIRDIRDALKEVARPTVKV